MKNILLIAGGVLIWGMSLAQYPVIPEKVQDSADQVMKEIEKISDERWEEALSVIEREAENGRPYIPRAEKPEDLPQADIPAFPGAEGGGKYTAGGRGGKVLVVTNLEDDGPGSFRWACEQGGARIIVFNVAGIIHLKSPVSIRAPYVTIAGQSAPGDGVCIAGETVEINTHDVIIRYMRFRRGNNDVTNRDDALGGNAIGNVIIDHVSASWGLDENLSIYRHVFDRGGENLKLPTVNITIQNSISSEGLDTYNHAFGSTIGGLNSMFTRNLWAHNVGRNPSVGMYGDFGFVNNVVFNWWNRTVDGGDHRSFYYMINNYMKPGPITPENKPIAYRILKPENGRDEANKNNFGKAFVSGNVTEGYPEVTNDNWAGGVQPGGRPDAYDIFEKIKLEKPSSMAPVSVVSAETAYEFVLANAGATLPVRDAVDKRVIESVRTGKAIYDENAKPFNGPYIKNRLPEDSYKKGIIRHPDQVGGYPEYEGTPYQDTDNDGIPDRYEIENGLDPNNPEDASEIAENGYSNIENYLNSLVDINTVRPISGKNTEY